MLDIILSSFSILTDEVGLSHIGGHNGTKLRWQIKWEVSVMGEVGAMVTNHRVRVEDFFVCHL